jgi:hypothetical protein
MSGILLLIYARKQSPFSGKSGDGPGTEHLVNISHKSEKPIFCKHFPHGKDAMVSVTRS